MYINSNMRKWPWSEFTSGHRGDAQRAPVESQLPVSPTDTKQDVPFPTGMNGRESVDHTPQKDDTDPPRKPRHRLTRWGYVCFSSVSSEKRFAQHTGGTSFTFSYWQHWIKRKPLQLKLLKLSRPLKCASAALLLALFLYRPQQLSSIINCVCSSQKQAKGCSELFTENEGVRGVGLIRERHAGRLNLSPSPSA